MKHFFLGADLNGFLRRLSMLMSLAMLGAMWWLFGHNREWTPASPEALTTFVQYSTRILLIYLAVQGGILLITSMESKGIIEIGLDFITSLFPLGYGLYRLLLNRRGIEVLDPNLAKMVVDWTLTAGIDAMYDLGIAFLAATRQLRTT